MLRSVLRNRVWLISVVTALACGSAYLGWKLAETRSLGTRFAVDSSVTPSPSMAATAKATVTFLPSATFTPTLYPSITPSPLPTETAVPPATTTALSTTTLTATVTPSSTPWPLPTPDGNLRVLDVPILMYHYVSVPPPGADAVRQDLSVSPEHFEEQLVFLREQGYTPILLYQLLLALETGMPLPPKPVVLTFDDGYRDNYVYAFPLLQRYGYTATFFVNVAFIDDGYPTYLTWDELQEMAAAGMSIEAHGYTHPDLRKLDMDALVFQVLRPKEAIEARTNQPVHFFCYPSGEYDERVIRVLQSAKYWGAVTLISGVEQRSDRPFEWQRIRVRGRYAVHDLAKLLSTYTAGEAH